MESNSTHAQVLNQATHTLFTLDNLRSIEEAVQSYGKELLGDDLALCEEPNLQKAHIPLPFSGKFLEYKGPISNRPWVLLLAQLATQAADVARMKLQGRRHAALASVELSINQPHELKNVLDQIVKATTDLLPATGGASITLWDPAEESFVISASTVPNQPPNTTAKRVRNKGGATRWIIDHARPMIVNDTRNDPFGANRMLDEYKLYAYAGYPMLTESGVLGVLYALDTHVRWYSDDDQDFLEALAARAALAVSRVKVYEELRTTNRLLEDRQRELESANQELEDFAYIVSHDLKTPLFGVKSLSQFVMEDYGAVIDEAGNEMLQQMGACIQNMTRLIDDILEYSRLNHLESNCADVEMSSLFERLKALMPATEHSVELPENLPTLWADETRLLQVFQNLIGNALKFMDKPQGTISVSFDEDEAFWWFTVQDDGPGIAAEHFDAIFQAFRGKVTQTTQSSTGIGLAICRRVVDQHGGEITVQSTLGEGSTFRFSLAKPTSEAPD